MTTQKQVRAAFWEAAKNGDLPGIPKKQAGWSQNDYDADIRMAWCDYVDALQRDGVISEALAGRVTL